jgi:hypothetical protein
MAKVRAAKIGAITVCTLVALLVAEIASPWGVAWATETGNHPAVEQAGRSPTETPAASGTPPSSLWTTIPLWRKILAISTTLVGLAAVGGGAYFLWENNTCPSSGNTCAYTPHASVLASWLLVAGGAAATLGGVTMMLVPISSESHAVAGFGLVAAF